MLANYRKVEPRSSDSERPAKNSTKGGLGKALLQKRSAPSDTRNTALKHDISATRKVANGSKGKSDKESGRRAVSIRVLRLEVNQSVENHENGSLFPDSGEKVEALL